MTTPTPSFETLQLHAGQRVGADRARAVPLYNSTSFVFNSSAHGANLFALKEFGAIYSRIGNPTTAVFEERMAALEGGVGAVAAASGQAAQFMAIAAIARAGQNIVTTAYLYGGSYNQFKIFFARFGIDFRFVASDDPAEFEKHIDENTRGIYLESIGNPRFNIPDFSKFSALADKHKIPLIVDNTFGCGGYLVQPISKGAHIVVHSATKWITGNGTTIGGVVIDSGNFDWAASGKFPDFVEESAGYKGIKFVENFGRAAFAVKVRVEVLKDLGACLSPSNALSAIHGLETLSLRVERHCQNALALARWLEKRPEIASVSYPGLESHAYHAVAKANLRQGMFGGVLSFETAPAYSSSKIVDNLLLISHLANVGDMKSCVIAPAYTTHSQNTPEELAIAGISKGLIRVSVGTEGIEDIKNDFLQAFAKAGI